jgi:ketosteroid isomerase-like protein
MSEANVGFFLRLHEALDAREAPEQMYASDYRLDTVDTAVTSKTYHGSAGMREWIRDYFDVFGKGARLEVEEVIADGDDYVVGRVGLRGIGASSGAPLHLRWINVIWFSDGKATRAAGYRNRAEALEAVGLAE